MLILLSLLWLAADPSALQAAGFFALRGAMVQYSGILAIGCMSGAMILALRPRGPERWLGGLDKMYRLHKWLGIGGLVLAVTHWLWSQGPKWAVGLGWLQRPGRGPSPAPGSVVEQALMTLRDPAEGLGEWAFYAAVVLIAVALIQLIPYRLFYKTHRWLAACYLVLAFHSLVLMTYRYWLSPLGLVMAILLACGSAAAIWVLLRRVGAGRQVRGTITELIYYPELRVLEEQTAVPSGWPGHAAGQFAFVTSDASEGAHPYTIASAWNDAERRITFITKELGDHTRTLRDRLQVGQQVKIEGPYGCFTFEDACPRQIWVGAGIGITPFIARMKQLALERQTGTRPPHTQAIDLFHPTADYSEEAIAKLAADAAGAGIHLHVLHDARHGRLNGEHIRATVPEWRNASIWFCGPAGFGEKLREDFAAHGMQVTRRFHQELFALR